LFRGLTGLDRSGLGSADCDISLGDGGGDGVDVVDKKVGPCSAGTVGTGESTFSGKNGMAFSTARLLSRVENRFGSGAVIVVCCSWD
jgi:hypothetical protein